MNSLEHSLRVRGILLSRSVETTLATFDALMPEKRPLYSSSPLPSLPSDPKRHYRKSPFQLGFLGLERLTAARSRGSI